MITRAAPIDALVGELVASFEANARATQVAGLLETYARAHRDWEPFALFTPGAYSRNLVERTRWFDLLVLCWDVGQASPIHNHEGQRCWMAVLDGRVEEAYFRTSPSARELVPGQVKVHAPGAVAYINDDIALHRVTPADGRRAISLHLYSLPFDACNIYDPVTGAVERKSLTLHSRRGKVLAPQT